MLTETDLFTRRKYTNGGYGVSIQKDPDGVLLINISHPARGMQATLEEADLTELADVLADIATEIAATWK